MKSKLTCIVILCLLSIGLWSCEDIAPPTGGGSGGGVTPPGSTTKLIRVSGSVLDLATSLPLDRSTVYRNSVFGTDSTVTDANGNFSFEVNLGTSDSLYLTVTARSYGYLPKSLSFTALAGLQYSLDIRLDIDLSTKAVIRGVVRDSTTSYPLRSSNVLFAVPGFSDSRTTSVDGTFIYIVDLVDQTTLPVVVTISHSGYKSKQATYVVSRGTSTDLGGILLSVDQGSTVGQVVGRVFDAQTRQPIINSAVTLTSSLVTDSVLTSGDGGYLFSIDLQGLPSLSGSLKVSKNGYRNRTLAFSVNSGASAYNDVYLDRDTTTGVARDSGSGEARSIALINVSNREISVYGVGGTEASILVWEVRDSLGFPIDIDHRDTVVFNLIGTPVLGGAYISPASAMTNVSGRVATTVNSGSVAGALQFTATLRRNDGSIIQSTPVLITVNAGLPAQTHFSIGPAQFNFAGYDWIARTNQISVQVGDKYSNPVKTGTAVYFNTPGGVIAASGFTDVSSHATVTLYSGNPQPNDPVFGPGFARVAATTLGEGGTFVSDTTLVLFSGRSEISNVNPATFTVLSGGRSGPINYTVSDRFGNPLAPGTLITVTLQYTPPPNSQINLIVTGDVSILLGDTQARGAGTTQFTFEAVDQTLGGVTSVIGASAIITVTGPNGAAPNWIVTGSFGN